MDQVQKKIKIRDNENQIWKIKDNILLLNQELQIYDINKQKCQYEDFEDLEQEVENLKNQIIRLKKVYKKLEVKQIVQNKEINSQQYMGLFKENLKEKILENDSSYNSYHKEQWYRKQVDFTSSLFPDNIKLYLNSDVRVISEYGYNNNIDYSLGGSSISVENISEDNCNLQNIYKFKLSKKQKTYYLIEEQSEQNVLFNFQIDWKLEDDEHEQDYYDVREKPIKLDEKIKKPDYNENFVHVLNLKKFISEYLDPENNLANNQNFNMEVLVDELSQFLRDIAVRHCNGQYAYEYGFQDYQVNQNKNNQ